MVYAIRLVFLSKHSALWPLLRNYPTEAMHNKLFRDRGFMEGEERSFLRGDPITVLKYLYVNRDQQMKDDSHVINLICTIPMLFM